MVTTRLIPTIPSEEYTKFINNLKYNNNIITPEFVQGTQNLNWLKEARNGLQKAIRGLNLIKQNNQNSGDLSSLDMYLDETTKKINLVEDRIRNRKRW
jgi:hypothetical protein